ncbi:MAG: VWA domain-containing protein [Actinomycetota bacterium]|nr:VWA domain-containing protein [Actinomycetota bacterium]
MLPSQSPALLRGVDRAAFCTAFSLRLRDAGVAVGFSSMESFVRALAACPPDSLPRLYWTARISLVRRTSDLELFDAVFAAVFDDAVLSLDPNARRQALPAKADDDDVYAALPAKASADADGGGLPWITRPSIVAGEPGSESTLAVPELLPSDVEALAEVPFEDLNADELGMLGRWLESALADWPTRRSRRLACHRLGRRIAMRATLARARRTGWESIELVRSRPIRRRRRLVMLCDVSQSMQAQSSAYLHLMRAAVLSADAEVFAFGTLLTRLTPVIAHRSPEAAIELASARVSDRFGGTRIASNLRALLSSHHGGATRGAVVLIASDGWDSDDPGELAAVMAKLRRRAHRIIWINPRAGAPSFEPLVGAMAAALPHCDELLPAHNIRSLRDVISAIGRAR